MKPLTSEMQSNQGFDVIQGQWQCLCLHFNYSEPNTNYKNPEKKPHERLKGATDQLNSLTVPVITHE